MTFEGQPVLRCAVCDKAIQVASQAVVVYPRGIEPGGMHRISLTHPGACQMTAQANLENDYGPALWMELTVYGDRLRDQVLLP